VTRFRNPFASLSDLVAKAFTIIGDRDAARGRGAFIVRLSHPKTRRSSRAPTPHTGGIATRRHGVEHDID